MEPRSAKDLRWLALGLCAGAFLVTWLPRLFWGLWTDEASTFWMACEGWREALVRVAMSPGQSNLYGFLQSFFTSRGPWLEPLMRAPSVMAMIVAGWYLKRISETLIHREAGWPAAVLFFCAPDVINFGTSARPYAMALAAALASFWYLLAWLDGGKRTTIVQYLAASILTLYFHYFFGFIFVVQAIYLMARKLSGQPVGLALPVTAAIVLPASLIPLVRHLLLTAKEAITFAFPTPPTLLQLLQMCFHPPLLLILGLGFVLVALQKQKLRWQPVALPRASFTLLGVWLVLGPVVFFLAARLTPHAFFSTRFQLWAGPAFLLLAAWVITGLPFAARRIMLLAFFAGTILHPGNILQSWRDSAMSWREPIEVVRSLSAKEAAPVFVASGLVESGAMDWQTMSPATHRLFAPLTVYPLRNPTVPLPYQFGEEVKDFVQKAPKARELYLLAAADSGLGPWMKSYMEQQGYTAAVSPVNDYVVMHFTQSATSARRQE
jgi:hypothetical protein